MTASQNSAGGSAAAPKDSPGMAPALSEPRLPSETPTARGFSNRAIGPRMRDLLLATGSACVLATPNFPRGHKKPASIPIMVLTAIVPITRPVVRLHMLRITLCSESKTAECAITLEIAPARTRQELPDTDWSVRLRSHGPWGSTAVGAC
jgi:hypothetical protein